MKIIFRIISLLIVFFFLFVLHLTFIGIETDKFNKHIQNKIRDINQNLEVELKQIKIILSPLNLKLNIKTVGSEFSLNEKVIEIESIKSNISLLSFFQKEYSLENLEVSTKSLDIKNTISFFRKFNNTPELFILDKITKKGYLIADIKLNFDSNGKIKNDFEIKGLIKNLSLHILKDYKIDKSNLTFNYQKDNLIFNNIDSSINNKKLIAKKIQIKKEINDFYVSGNFDLNKLNLNKNELISLFKFKSDIFKIDNINFSAKSNFSFKINKKYRITNLKIFSDMKIDKMSVIQNNEKELQKTFPKIKTNIDFFDHTTKVEYSKKELSISGDGKILLQEENDKINYTIFKKKNFLKFDTFLEINKNPVFFKFLNFQKEDDSKLNIKINGFHEQDRLMKITSLIIKEKKNEFKIVDLTFDKRFKIKELKKLELDYVDKENKKNSIRLFNKNKNYFLKGKNFNANYLIENLLNNDEKKSSIFSKKNINIDLEIETVNLDKDYNLKNLKGNLNFIDKELKKANLSARFSDNDKFKFTVKDNQNERITILTLEKAEPLVKRYKFIKGFDDGILDFYSSKKGDLSSSTLKIYDFRLKKLPILTKILTLASLQGIADILSGEGIRFDELEMNFQNKKNLMTINEIYAIGPAISILMDGYVEKNKLVSLRGTLVPATTINKVIGSIPILGKILVGTKTGEGVFGVSFKVKGPPKNLETTVNPIKTLTPRFITRTLEKIKKN